VDELIDDFLSASRYTREFSSRRAKLVTSIAMFYDLETPLQFMREVFETLADDGVWVIEQSYLPEMLKMNSYDTVCHEHLEYYALKLIMWMAGKVGFQVLDVTFNSINGGSFSVAMIKSTSLRAEPANVGTIIRNEENQGLDGSGPYRSFA